jgi:alpha-L-fucosidase 2
MKSCNGSVLPRRIGLRWCSLPSRFVWPALVLLAAGLLFGLGSAGAQSLPAGITNQTDVVYSSPDGETLQFDAYLQPGDGPHPAVMHVHGGGFVTGDKRPCPSYILEPYLLHGYSVFTVNYRLAPRHPFPAATDDVAAAVAFIKQHASQWQIDPARMVLTGESAGGLISALVGATLTSNNVVAAVIPVCGEVDLELRVSENPCFMDGQAFPHPAGGCISKGLAAFLGFSELTDDSQRKTLRAASTITHIRRDMPPYLLVHGTRDFGVPYEQSVSLHYAMLKAGADCTLLPVVGGGHLNWTPEQWKEVTSAEMAWLEQKLKTRASQ